MRTFCLEKKFYHELFKSNFEIDCMNERVSFNIDDFDDFELLLLFVEERLEVENYFFGNRV